MNGRQLNSSLIFQKKETQTVADTISALHFLQHMLLLLAANTQRNNCKISHSHRLILIQNQQPKATDVVAHPNQYLSHSCPLPGTFLFCLKKQSQ